MTKKMLKHVQGSWPSSSATLLNYVCGRLIAHNTATGGDPYSSIDVELLLAAIKLLSRRDELEIAPFVSVWDGGIDALTRQHDQRFIDQGGKVVVDAFKDRTGWGPDARKVEESIRDIVRSEVGRGNPRAFTDLFGELVGALRVLLQFDDDATDYLQPLIELCRRQAGLTILTLNYDLTIETAAGRSGEGCSTGFASWALTGKLSFNSDLHLLKLHGSVDWRRQDGRRRSSSPGTFPQPLYTTADDPYSDHGGLPIVVFGAGEKLRSDGPFLDLFMEAKRSMAEADEMVVVGYSFRDDHVNHLIGEWLGTSPSRTLVVIAGPNFPTGWTDASNTFTKSLYLHLVDSHAETPSGRRFEDRLTVIREYARKGLAELLAGPPYASVDIEPTLPS